MHPESPSWIAQLVPEDCGVPNLGLLIRHLPDAPLQFLTDLLAVDAGRRDFTSAAKEYLLQCDFAAAAKCAQQIANPSLSEEIQNRYSSWLKSSRQSLYELQRRARDISKESGQLSSLGDAQVWIDIAADALQDLPPMRQGMLADLASVSKKQLSDFDEACAQAQRQLAQAQRESQQKQEERKRHLREVSRKINDLADDLLLDRAQPAQAAQIERLLERAGSAKTERNLEKLTRIHELLKVISGGQTISDEEIGPSRTTPWDSDPALPRLLSAPSTALLSKAVSVTSTEYGIPRLELTDLSELVQQDLERTHGKLDSPADSSMQSSEPLDFDKQSLEQQYARAKPGAANKDFRAMSQYLLSWAKLNLLSKRYNRALTLFGDALRWLSQNDAEKRSADVAMWGLLLSLGAPYLPKEEQQLALAPANLSELCERKIGHFPLLRMEQMGLIPELAQHIVRLGWPTAGKVLRAYLLSYFAMRSVAAAEFAAETANAIVSVPDVALPLLALLYDDQLPDREPGMLLSQLESSVPSLADVSQKREYCTQLREMLLPFADDWDLVASVTDALQHLAKRLQKQSSSERRWSITHELLSTEVTLVDGARLLIRLKLEGSVPLRGVSTTARLLNGARVDAKSFDGVLAPLEPLALVEPGVIYELAIELRRFDDELCTSLYLELTSSAHAEDGADRVLEARNRFFSVRFNSQRSGTSSALNPYTFGLPIKNPDSIYGRAQTINQICDTLIGRDQDNAVLVHGDRKIGKTTLLSALIEDPRITKRYVPLTIDLEKIPDYCENSTFYLQYLVQPIQQKLREIGLGTIQCSEAALQRSPEQVFEEFFRQADRVLQANSRRMLLILDEFERVMALVEQASEGAKPAGHRGMGPEVLAALRAAVQPARCISLVLSGVTYLLRRHTVRLNDRLARFGAEIELQPLDENGAQLLVRLPPRGQYDVTPSAVELILRETARQPYLIQKLCHQLYADIVRCHSRLATIADVQRVLGRMARDAGGFVHLLEPIQSTQDFRLIQAMAMLQSGRQFVRLKDIMRQLQRESGKLEEHAVRQRLSELAEQVPSVIERHPATHQLRLTVPLFARFLRQQPESRAPFYILKP